MLTANLHRHPRLARAAVRLMLLAGAGAGCLGGGLVAPAASFAFPPVNISPPTITGTAQQGQTLTEVHGSWTNFPTSYAYQWLRCNSSGSSCVSISGANAQTYMPVAEDVGHKLRVQETASNFSGPGSPAESAATAVVVPAGPRKHRATHDHRDRAAGPDPDGGARVVDELADRLRLPVAAVQLLGLELRVDLGRQRADLHAGRRRRRSQAARAGDREQRRRLKRRDRISGHSRGRPTPSPENTAPPTITRHRTAGPDPHRGPRLVDELADRLRLPVAAVQLLGLELRCRSRAPTRRRTCRSPKTSATSCACRRPRATPVARAARQNRQPHPWWSHPSPKTPLCRRSPAPPAGPDPHRGARLMDELARRATPTSGCGATTSAAAACRSPGDQPDLRPGARRRGSHAEGPGDREQRRRPGQPGDLERDRARHTAAARQHLAADDHRHRPAGPDAHRGARLMDEQPDGLHLPVAAVRQPRQRLPADLRTDQARPTSRRPATWATR